MDETESFATIDPAALVLAEAQAAEIAAATLFELPLAWSAEGMRFLGRRCRAETEHVDRLLACRSLPDLAAEQVRYLSAAAYDCCDGTGAVVVRMQSALRPPPPIAD